MRNTPPVCRRMPSPHLPVFLRKPYAIGICALLAASLPAARADIIKADGFRYDNVTVLGLKDNQLQTTIRGAEKLFDLSTVDLIEITNQPNFNKAELARKNAAVAAPFYQLAIESITDRKLKALAQRRAADLTAAQSAPSPESSGNPDLFPRVLPSFISPSAATAADIAEPLAKPAEDKQFHATYDAILQDAAKGSPEDRAATAELLARRAAAAPSPGTRKLLLLAAYDLAKLPQTPPAVLSAAAQAALRAIDGTSIALTSRRIAILTDMHAVNPHESHYAPAVIADQWLALAELYFYSGMFKESRIDLDNANQWAAQDPAYAAKMTPQIERFARELGRRTALAAKLAASPDDPDANTAKGLEMLALPGNAVDAAPFLGKSSKPEIQRLAKALASRASDAAARLEIAAAAADALALAAEDDQLPLAFLLDSQAKSVAADPKANETQKARAELLLIKAEHFVGKAGVDQIANDPKMFRTKFFGLESQGKKIVYIVDHSGSMLDNFDFLREEAVKSINSLEEGQSFAVILVSENIEIIGTPEPVKPPARPRAAKTPPPKPSLPIVKWMEASNASKKTFGAEIAKFRAQGQNDDLLEPFQNAFEAAFAAKPDTIYFLTDGHFDPRLTAVVKKLNAGKTVHVNTLAFVNKEPSYEAQLSDMAKSNGGTYKFVSEKDLGK